MDAAIERYVSIASRAEYTRFITELGEILDEHADDLDEGIVGGCCSRPRDPPRAVSARTVYPSRRGSTPRPP